MEKHVIIQAICDAVDELNSTLPEEKRLDKSPETQLYGDSARLDSLGLVDLILAVEQKIQERFHKNLTLASERALSMKKSPFRTINTLAGYINELIEESGHD